MITVQWASWLATVWVMTQPQFSPPPPILNYPIKLHTTQGTSKQLHPCTLHRVWLAWGRGGTNSCFSTSGLEVMCDFQFGSHGPAGNATSDHICSYDSSLVAETDFAHWVSANSCTKTSSLPLCSKTSNVVKCILLCCAALWEGEPQVPEKWPSCGDSGVHGKWRRLHRHNIQEPGQAEGQGKWLWWAAAQLWQRVHHPPPGLGPYIWRWIRKEEQTQVILRPYLYEIPTMLSISCDRWH